MIGDNEGSEEGRSNKANFTTVDFARGHFKGVHELIRTLMMRWRQAKSGSVGGSTVQKAGRGGGETIREARAKQYCA